MLLPLLLAEEDAARDIMEGCASVRREKTVGSLTSSSRTGRRRAMRFYLRLAHSDIAD